MIHHSNNRGPWEQGPNIPGGANPTWNPDEQPGYRGQEYGGQNYGRQGGMQGMQGGGRSGQGYGAGYGNQSDQRYPTGQYGDYAGGYESGRGDMRQFDESGQTSRGGPFYPGAGGSAGGGMGGRGYQSGQWYQGGQSHGGYPENTEAFGERAGWYGRSPAGNSGRGAPRAKRTGPKNYQRSDERLKEHIIEKLMDNSSVDIGNLECDVKDGTVTLSGTVDTRSDRYEIENVVDDVWGVKDITNNIRVKSAQGADYGASGGSSYGSSASQGRETGQQGSPKAR